MCSRVALTFSQPLSSRKPVTVAKGNREHTIPRSSLSSFPSLRSYRFWIVYLNRTMRHGAYVYGFELNLSSNFIHVPAGHQHLGPSVVLHSFIWSSAILPRHLQALVPVIGDSWVAHTWSRAVVNNPLEAPETRFQRFGIFTVLVYFLLF